MENGARISNETPFAPHPPSFHSTLLSYPALLFKGRGNVAGGSCELRLEVKAVFVRGMLKGVVLCGERRKEKKRREKWMTGWLGHG